MNADGTMRDKEDQTVVETCDSDVCLWQGRQLYEKFNTSVEPCNDFYGYVCGSRNWYRSHQRIDTRPYRVHSVAQLMYDLRNLFAHLQRARAAEYARHPTLFTNQLLFFLGNCTDAEKKESLWVTLKSIYTENLIEGWPFKKDSRVMRISDVTKVLDKYIGLNSFVKVSLMKDLEEDEYKVHLEAPQLPLQRHQLIYTNESVADYAKRIEKLLSIFTDHDMSKAAEDIVQLEQRLLQIVVPRRFTPFDNRTSTIKELQRRNMWHWLTYLNFIMEDAGVQFHRQSSVICLDKEYVSKLALTLRKFSLKTLLNYVGYTLMVKFSPLLPNEVDFLIPLSHDNYVETVPDRLQACLHMLEDLCPHWIRKLARMTFSKENVTSPSWHYDEEMNKLLYLIRETMKQSVLRSPWLNQVEVDAAAQKIDKLRVEFLGARESEAEMNAYYPQFVSAFPPNNPLLGYYKLLNETRSFYWITNSSFDLDARYQTSAFVAGVVEYKPERNVLFIPHGLIAFANNISQTFDPLFVPLIAPAILRGMFSAVDRRGSTVNARNQVVGWWAPESRDQFEKRLRCFQDQYSSEAQTLLASDYDEDCYLDDNVADNAVLPPLHDVYLKAMHLARPLPRNTRVPGLESLTTDKLFFVNFAVSHCDSVRPGLFQRQIQYKYSVPAQLRVNVPLKNYPKFAEAFRCPPNTPMNPDTRCELW
ncbi:neprilysin-1-like [Ixodes scapularis]|uniref:neprilysin-1-like n=1 Tax=Ixodes scapularis TaxID=6945 RepID=UPI001C382180|nr:neprilysin-1-like [Ixodes scapularis]